MVEELKKHGIVGTIVAVDSPNEVAVKTMEGKTIVPNTHYMHWNGAEALKSVLSYFESNPSSNDPSTKKD